MSNLAGGSRAISASSRARRDEIGKGGRDILARARVEPAHPALGHRLNADAVPFPLGGMLGRVERGQIAGIGRSGQHDRSKGRARRLHGLRGAAVEPAKKRRVGRREAVPELENLVRLDAAVTRERCLGELRGAPHAHAPVTGFSVA